MKKDGFDIANDITVFLLVWLPVIGIGLTMLNYAIDHGGFLLSLFVFSVLSLIWTMIANALAPLVFIISLVITYLLLLTKNLLTRFLRKFT